MRKLIAAEFVSVDGFIEGPNREMDWVKIAEDFRPEWDTILLGRVTYEIWVESWPKATGPMADFINGAPKFVFSRTLNEVQWGKWKSPELVRDHVSDEISKLKQQSGKDMAVIGSAGLVQAFTNLGLIDEYRLMIFPVILGSGKALFRGINGRHSLKLKKTSRITAAYADLRYEVQSTP